MTPGVGTEDTCHRSPTESGGEQTRSGPEGNPDTDDLRVHSEEVRERLAAETAELMARMDVKTRVAQSSVGRNVGTAKGLAAEYTGRAREMARANPPAAVAAAVVPLVLLVVIRHRRN